VAAVPRLIKFSGAVRDARGEPVTSAAVRLTFAVYSEQQGGAALWVESQVVQLDEQGHYSVLLGATRADGMPVELFPAGKARWLGVQVEGRDEDSRVLLVSVPYALKAEDAAMLGGRSAADFVLGEQLKEEVRTQVAAQTPGIATQAVEMLVNNPPNRPAIAEGPSTFTCATTGDCVAVAQSSTGRALRTTATSASEAILIQQNGTGYGLRALVPGNVALYGQITGSAGTSYGVKGQTTSTTGAGVFGYNLAATGLAYGVLGQTASTEGTAFFGRAVATTGATIGLRGHADSTSGTGILGQATAASGTTTGIVGRVFSAAGTALVVDNTQGGKLLSAQVNGAEKFSVSGAGKVTAGDAVFAGSGVAGAALVANNTAGGMIFSGRNNGVENFSIDWTGKITGGGGTFTGSTSLFNPIVSVTQSGSGGGLRVTSTNALGGAIYGTVSASSGTVSGVLGDSQSASGTGVTGFAFETGGTGVYGRGGGIGLLGEGPVGVRGTTTASNGTAGLFKTASSGSKLLSGLDFLDTEVFSVSGNGNLMVSGSVTTGTGLISGSGSYSGTTADQIVTVLQNGTGTGLVATTLSTVDGPAALRGQATSTAPNSYGIGVHGFAASNVGIGVKGEASGSVGVGVKGVATYANMLSIGVLGETAGNTTNSAGVYGKATATSDYTYGVIGDAHLSAYGVGVRGWGQRAGVVGDGAVGAGGIGVEGTGDPGVKGDAYQFSGTGVHGTTRWGIGVLGESTYGGYAVAIGVKGIVASSQDGTTGVFGDATSGTGATIGVHGRSAATNGTGVLGEATDDAFTTFGVKGTSQSGNGTAVAGIATSGGVGVYGESDSWAAGDFNRTDDSDDGVILQARNGDDVEFKVWGNGNVYADGTFTGGGADFAEAMAVRGDRDQYEPGDVLTIDPTSDRRLTLARDAYSTDVAGIYSTKPGILGKPYSMGDPRLGMDIPLAVVGIVPCKVSAENGPIGRGDLLVSASTPGHAMRGADRDRMLGAIVGKALESLASGTGVIQVLVTLQ
jgi:hypothetical protein